ncbi:MAG: 30S ribosomal protein S4 [Nitrospinae bacterium]|nr:30S ribosomal protein S4 [Nitrospinota bacterium]MBI3814410.1 30S ribosomal protein S4 [Nitrospinota bacterium]
MARYRESVCRLCRREGIKLFLKGSRCLSDKCALDRRNYAPGQHGQNRVKLSEYGTQLREKQRGKRIYGIMERQFRNYFRIADRKKGITGEMLLQLLERRLDNVVYRLGLAPTRRLARQLVRHNHFAVNSRKVNIPSYLVKKGDIIEIRENSRDLRVVRDSLKDTRGVPAWLQLDAPSMKGIVQNLPAREEINAPLQEHLIVELYSK